MLKVINPRQKYSEIPMKTTVKKLLSVLLVFVIIAGTAVFSSAAITYTAERPFRTFYYKIPSGITDVKDSDMRQLAGIYGVSKDLGYIHGASDVAANCTLTASYWNGIGIELMTDAETSTLGKEYCSFVPLYVFLDGRTYKAGEGASAFIQNEENTVTVSGNTFTVNSYVGTASTGFFESAGGTAPLFDIQNGTVNFKNLVITHAYGGVPVNVGVAAESITFDNVSVNSVGANTFVNAASLPEIAGGIFTATGAVAADGLYNCGSVAVISGGEFYGTRSGLHIAAGKSVGTVSGGVFGISSDSEYSDPKGGFYNEGTVGSIVGGTFFGYKNEGTVTDGISGGVFDFTSTSLSDYSDIKNDIAPGAVARIDSEDGNGKFTVIANSGLTSGKYLSVPSCAVGYGYITSSFGDHTAYTVVKATKPVESIDISETSITVDLEAETVYLSAKFNPEGSSSVLTWTSSSPSVATVSDGKVTLLHWGTTTVTVTTENGKSASCTVTVTDVANGYYYMTDAPTFTPVKDGCIFAGWYKVNESDGDVDETAFRSAHSGDISDFYPQPYYRGDSLSDGAFLYARFADSGILGVKAQVREGVKDSSDFADIRFISTADCVMYAAVGFELTFGDTAAEVFSTSVYPTLSGGEKTYEPSMICSESQFFSTYLLNNIPNRYFSSGITARAFVVNFDGSKSYGEPFTKRVSDAFINTVSIASEPDRTAYFIGESLELSGAKIRVDGTGDIVDVTSDMVSGFSSSTVGEKTVTINYKGMETYFTVSVIEKTKEFSVNGTFNSHMVLQRNAKTPVFGLGSDGDVITVSFNGQTKKGTVENGKWKIEFDPMEANAQSQTLVISSSAEEQTVTFTDILVGDVWLCSGQSNMFLRVGDLHPYAYNNDPYGDDGIIEDQYIVKKYYTEFHENANNPLVRSCWQWPGHENVKSEHTSPTPYDDILARMDWVVCDNSDPDLLDCQSAYAVSFALNIQEQIGVPVGVVCSSQGGSTIKEWIPIDGSSTSGFEYYMDGSNYKGNYYNSMIAPMMPFAFKGILWWQGESDALKYSYPAFSTFDIYEENDRYGEYLAKLVSTYRNGFTSCVDGSMPFIQSGIVYCNIFGIADLKEAWARFRDRQVSGKYTEGISEAYTANLWKYWVLGQADNVHSPRKWESGKAAAKIALTNVYGQ